MRAKLPLNTIDGQEDVDDVKSSYFKKPRISVLQETNKIVPHRMIQNESAVQFLPHLAPTDSAMSRESGLRIRNSATLEGGHLRSASNLKDMNKVPKM
jgi:hypothetical protein